MPLKGGRRPIAPAIDVLSALDHLRVAVTLFDFTGHLTYCNAHYHYLFRSFPAPDSLIGARYEDLIRLELSGGEIAPEHSADPEAFVAARLRRVADGDFRPFDIHLADGRIIELKSRRTSGGGTIMLWSDATLSRNLMARLEDAVQLSVDAFALWNERDQLMLCNSAFAELHGLSSAEDAAGMLFQDVTAQAASRGKFTVDGSMSAWLERRKDTHGATAGALTVSTTDGNAYLVRERATRGGSVTILTDVSERQRVEAALAEQTRALKRTKRELQKTKTEAKRSATYLADLARRLDAAEAEVDTAKSTLLRTMSHELKTPLNAIIGFADLLRSTPERFSPQQVGEYADLIHRAGGNLLRLLTQIMDLTKIAAGRYPLRREAQSVSAAFARTIDVFAVRADAKSIRFDLADCNGLCVSADETALNTMLAHLVENAVLYTPGSSTIRLTAAREEGAVRLAVADDGPGVAEVDLARILQPFEQAAASTLDHSSGAGLGLPLVKALAELHGGTLSLASVHGEGFTATLEFPDA